MLSVETLSFPALMDDPLVRMMMDSDGVSAAALRELLAHVRDVVAARDGTTERTLGVLPLG